MIARSPIAVTNEPTIEAMIASLHDTFGDNDLIVARRNFSVASGDVAARWKEVVDRLELRKAWSSSME